MSVMLHICEYTGVAIIRDEGITLVLDHRRQGDTSEHCCQMIRNRVIDFKAEILALIISCSIAPQTYRRVPPED